MNCEVLWIEIRSGMIMYWRVMVENGKVVKEDIEFGDEDMGYVL